MSKHIPPKPPVTPTPWVTARELGQERMTEQIRDLGGGVTIEHGDRGEVTIAFPGPRSSPYWDGDDVSYVDDGWARLRITELEARVGALETWVGKQQANNLGIFTPEGLLVTQEQAELFVAERDKYLEAKL